MKWIFSDWTWRMWISYAAAIIALDFMVATIFEYRITLGTLIGNIIGILIAQVFFLLINDSLKEEKSK